ncbi:hypothetical protein ABT364_20325 [Massilia sp. SR12]
MNKFATCSAVVATLFLAACGGGTSETNRTGSQIAVGEPAPGAPAKDEFIKQARAADCSDIANRLYIIDGKQVFWERTGNCPDASYRHVLYGLTPQNEQCAVSDSIAGPRTSCKDESQRALFDTITRNLDKPDLGTGRKVETIGVMPKEGAVAYKQLAQNQYSGVYDAQNLVLRDAASLQKFWSTFYRNQTSVPPVPTLDFNRQMVIAVAVGAYSNGCNALVIDKVAVSGETLLVNYHVTQAAGDVACTTSITYPAAMLVLDRIDGKVDFIKG